MANKQGVFKEKAKEYWKANKVRKGAILDSVCEVTGLTRKGAIKRLRRMQLWDPANAEARGRKRYYTPDCIAALKEVWEISSESCAENLYPLVGEHIDIQIREKDWHHGDEATDKLRSMSLGSMKVYLGGFSRTRRNFGGKSTTQKSSIVSRIPVRMDGWDEAEVGVMQTDTVAHCGDSVAGDFVYTVNTVDVATLWGVRRAQWQKGQSATHESLSAMRAQTPFPWTEIHPDTGKEFINWHLLGYATDTNLRFTRSRPYHKNDNTFVEERNGHIVRVYIGWQRLDVPDVVDALNAVYEVLDIYLNHFSASRRVLQKELVGSRWKITREKVAKTPYQRILQRDDVSEAVKEKLRADHRQLNPKQLRSEIDRRIKRVFDIQKRHEIPKR